MSSSLYYKEMRLLALRKREEYSISTSEISLSSLRAIYKQEDIRIDVCPRKLRYLKAAYFNDSDGTSVLLNMNLPIEPRLFAMIHELKHHYLDQDKPPCAYEEIYDYSPITEIGAEVFAAEFIFPEIELREYIPLYMSPGGITPEDIVRMKYNSPAIVSYQFFLKSLSRLNYIEKDQFKDVKWKQLHTGLYGKPYYRKPKN